MNTTHICIVGAQSLNHELLAYAVQRELQLSCKVADETGNGLGAGKTDEQVLFLLDYADGASVETAARLDVPEAGVVSNRRAALFNLPEHYEGEAEALAHGITGFFFARDTLRLFLKGIKTMLEGEIWLSRESLVRVALKGVQHRPQPTPDKTNLTRREIEILTLVSLGAKNDEIATKLFISPHTVKTHLYNVFKKIDVPNRIQAALWVAKNL